MFKYSLTNIYLVKWEFLKDYGPNLHPGFRCKTQQWMGGQQENFWGFAEIQGKDLDFWQRYKKEVKENCKSQS